MLLYLPHINLSRHVHSSYPATLNEDHNDNPDIPVRLLTQQRTEKYQKVAKNKKIS